MNTDTIMNNGSEWYWNLNLHRNQSVLNNSSAVSSTKLPISSAMYTSAVLTDRGICVGMRNVNLKGAGQNYSSKSQNIPKCCSNTNIVGQRNNQTWTDAYDLMRFSALTDPSMATEIEHHRNHTKWKDRTMFPADESMHECVEYPTNPISAELNPFHLFGDKSILSSIQFKDKKYQHFARHFMSDHESHSESMVPISHVPYHNYHYFAEEFDENRIQSNGYPNLHFPSRSKSPTSHLLCTKLKAAMTKHNRRMDNNAFRSAHVVAPKKKWIRNYMQSNSMVFFELLFIHFLCHLYTIVNSFVYELRI